MKISKMKQDVTSAEEGQWVDIGDGASVKVARIGNKAYNAFIKKATKPYAAALRSKTGLPDDVFEGILNKAYAETILLDWAGLEDDAGANLPYSKEKCLELFKDPEYKDFTELAVTLASEAETFRLQEVAETTAKSS